jgi:hypothetical protein
MCDLSVEYRLRRIEGALDAVSARLADVQMHPALSIPPLPGFEDKVASPRSEDKTPIEIADLISESCPHLTLSSDSYNAAILEAFRRGQRSK